MDYRDNKKKRALFVTTVSGFVPKFEMNNVKILQEYGYEVHYASNFENPVYQFEQTLLDDKHIICHHIDISKSPYAVGHQKKAIAQVKQIIQQESIDVVHCHTPMGAVVARCAVIISKKKPYVIYTSHGFHFYQDAPKKNWLLYYPVELFLSRFTDLLITINREDYETASGFPLKKGGHLEHIPGVGVCTADFAPKKEAGKRKREELHIPKDGFHIVTVGELNDNKNQKIVLEALARLNNPQIYYSLCGTGPREKLLRNLVKRYHLENQVRFLGYRKDVKEILQTADCFAFPAIREGLGIAAIEAMAAKVPLIVADNRGTREYAKHGYNSIVCRHDSTEQFAEGIDRLFSDKTYREALAQKGLEESRRFDICHVDAEMRKIYRLIESN